MGTCFPTFAQTPPSSIMLSLSRSAVIGSAVLALASAESLSPPFLQTALEVVSRASSSSEVLSLNLTNLIILLALKVAIVAFGLFSGGATGRSGADSELSQADMTGGMCFLLYTGGEEEKAPPSTTGNQKKNQLMKTQPTNARPRTRTLKNWKEQYWCCFPRHRATVVYLILDTVYLILYTVYPSMAPYLSAPYLPCRDTLSLV